MLLFAFLRGGFSIHCHSANEEGVPVPSKPFMALYCSAECATPTNSSLFPHLLCLRNAREIPLLPAALASVPFGFVLVRVRVRSSALLISGSRYTRSRCTCTPARVVCGHAFFFCWRPNSMLLPNSQLWALRKQKKAISRPLLLLSFFN